LSDFMRPQGAESPLSARKPAGTMMTSIRANKKKQALSGVRRRMLRERMAGVPFPNLLGMKLVKLVPGEAQISMTGDVKLHQYQRIVHGGAISSLADTAATFAALASVLDGMDVITIEFKVNLLAPFKSGKAVATGRIVHLGRRTCVAEVSIRNSATKEIIALGLFTMLCFSTNTK